MICGARVGTRIRRSTRSCQLSRPGVGAYSWRRTGKRPWPPAPESPGRTGVRGATAGSRLHVGKSSGKDRNRTPVPIQSARDADWVQLFGCIQSNTQCESPAVNPVRETARATRAVSGGCVGIGTSSIGADSLLEEKGDEIVIIAGSPVVLTKRERKARRIELKFVGVEGVL